MDNKEAYTIEEFCYAFSISRSFFYKLQNEGNAPKVIKLGTSVRILSTDIEAWKSSHQSAD